MLIWRLRDEGDKLLAVFEGLTPEQWQTVIYTDGMTWTIMICWRTNSAEASSSLRADVLNGGEGAPEGFDINAFNNREVAAKAERTPSSCCRFSLDPPDDDRFRRTSAMINSCCRTASLLRDDGIEDMFKLIYRHNMMHARDIRKALGAE
jgi:hypothetical protein